MSFFGTLFGNVRCPACGVYRKHPRDVDREREIRDYEDSEIGQMFRGFTGRSKQAARAFVCMECGHRFDLDTEMTWAKVAQDIGDDRARIEYRKVQEENQRD